MVQVLSVVGARPQFVKAAAVSLALARRGLRERLLHTGQHYDASLSAIFFDQLGIPRPAHELGVGSGTHARQTGAILSGVEDVLLREGADLVLIYGDTNSTLGAVLAAAKLHVPVAHVEAGMRSFNRRMPEEINRVVADHLASFHFCASETAARNLAAEGVTAGVHVVGDVMADCVRVFGDAALSAVDVGACFGVTPGAFALLTCHREENTDNADRLAGILGGLADVSQRLPVLFPAHPRVVKTLAAAGVRLAPGVRVIEPVGYLEMLALERAAALILTDSGGVQKEALYAGVPCVTLRDETEWVETVDAGWNVLAGADRARIADAARRMLDGPRPARCDGLYGDGHAAERIADLLAGVAPTGGNA